MEITLSGELLEWNEGVTEDLTITAAEREKFEREGFHVVELQDQLLAFRELRPSDGAVTIQPKSDMHGRMAVAGGHQNWGFSGYFRGFVYLEGKRKTLVDWWTLFPSREHHYTSQTEKAATAETVRSTIRDLAGTKVKKVPGGYAFNPTHVRPGRA